LTLRFKGRAPWFGFAVLIYPVVTAVIVMAGIASGLVTFDASGPSGSSGLIVAMAAVLPALVLKNTIEELIWRGFGTRTAAATGLTRVGAHVLVGVTWGLWHLPLYMRFMSRADFHKFTSLSWPLFIPIFLAGVIAVAVIFGELRLRTGSIWPGVVMHTVGGAVVNTLIIDGYLRFSGHSDALFSPTPSSIANFLLLGLIGMLLLRQAGWGNPERARKQAIVSDIPLHEADVVS
jgi:membrane protease YdiL (CAAX protease family)